MSFGFSPSDVVKLVEVSTRVYLAFKDANENSEVQVEGLVREFTAFHQCLIELDELMREYGKPLPFPFDDFKDTIERCEKSIRPYADNLVDKKMNFTKMVYTIRFMGKEKEIDGLRKQIAGHFQALQIRLHLEATKQTQRLLDTAPFRSMSLGGQWYTSNAFASAARTDTRALPAVDETDGLFQEWLVFSRWLKTEDERIAQEAGLVRPLSLGDTPAVAPSGDPQTAAVLYHLRRELEDAIIIEENRTKRAAMERRTHLTPSDAVREEMRSLPPIPQRTYTLDTEFSGLFSRFDAHTMRSSDDPASPAISSGSTSENHSYFDSCAGEGTSSLLAAGVSGTTSPASSLHRAITADTTPEMQASRSDRSRYSLQSLVTLALGDGALEWKRLSRKVQVERKVGSGAPESRSCDIHWRHNEDAGLAIRSVYRLGQVIKIWTSQSFPATGPSIPLSTSYPDGDVSLDFPRSSYGRLDRRCSDIKYTFEGHEASVKLQNLLYTNNGADAAELLFDRCILTVTSNLNKPECRGKNIRLWRKSEKYREKVMDVLVLLFYTSSLPEDSAHWVEEPHYAFQWLTDETCKKTSDKVTLVFSREPARWNRDKLLQQRKSSSASTVVPVNTSPTDRRGSEQPTRTASSSIGLFGVVQTGTNTSVSSAVSEIPSQSLLRGKGYRHSGDLNRFGYSELEIKFQSKSDRKDFVALWQEHVNQLVPSSICGGSR